MSTIETVADECLTENETPFIKVKTKSKRRTQLFSLKNHLIECVRSKTDVNITLKKIDEACLQIKQSSFFRKTLETILANRIKPIEQIICFGIGKFGDSPVSRHQLALLLELQSALELRRKIVFHEPLLNQGEKDVLNELKCILHEENLEGKLSINLPGTTIVYLPHCPKQLTNNLLWKNWNAHLDNLIFICNSFNTLVDSTPRRFLQLDANYILRIIPYCNEIPLCNSFFLPDRFNDTSIHTFDTSTKITIDFWQDNAEPQYIEYSELITVELLESLKI